MKLTADYIKKYTDRIKPSVFDCVDSTNALVRKAAQEGEAQGTAIIAERQTAGRGRLGRQFYSPDGGLYISFLLRPKISPEDTLFITVAAAVAVCRAIESVSKKKCQIKWVNDIYIDGKKVCGILTEGGFTADGSLQYAVLGVGINLFEPKGGYPDLPMATSIFRHSLCETKTKARIIAEFANQFFAFYDKLADKEFIKEYQSRSLLTGKRITYQKNDETHTATVVGIDDDARLIVKSDEKITALSTGEVQIVAAENLFEGKV